MTDYITHETIIWLVLVLGPAIFIGFLTIGWLLNHANEAQDRIDRHLQDEHSMGLEDENEHATNWRSQKGENTDV